MKKINKQYKFEALIEKACERYEMKERRSKNSLNNKENKVVKKNLTKKWKVVAKFLQ